MTEIDQNKQIIPVYIVTGFLGAGKTTILNSLLQQSATQQNFVIENEFGEINIDTNLISENASNIYELTNGCICCSMESDLYDALSDIIKRDTAPEQLFVETTGIADAGSLAAVFREVEVMKYFRLERIICVIDVETVEDYLEEAPEVGRQIVSADMIVLNKIQKVDSKYLEYITKVLNSFNPYALFFRSEDGILSKKNLLNILPEKPKFSLDSFRPQSGHSILTHLYKTSQLFNIDNLATVLNTTMMLFYSHVYRIKGFVKATDDKVYLIQSAGKTLEISPSTQSIEQSCLVFIGKDLQMESIEKLLENSLV